MVTEEAVGPSEIEHDVGEVNLMRRNGGQNQKTSVEPKHEAAKLGLHVEEKEAPRMSHMAQITYTNNYKVNNKQPQKVKNNQK